MIKFSVVGDQFDGVKKVTKATGRAEVLRFTFNDTGKSTQENFKKHDSQEAMTSIKVKNSSDPGQ